MKDWFEQKKNQFTCRVTGNKQRIQMLDFSLVH